MFYVEPCNSHKCTYSRVCHEMWTSRDIFEFLENDNFTISYPAPAPSWVHVITNTQTTSVDISALTCLCVLIERHQDTGINIGDHVNQHVSLAFLHTKSAKANPNIQYLSGQKKWIKNYFSLKLFSLHKTPGHCSIDSSMASPKGHVVTLKSISKKCV